MLSDFIKLLFVLVLFDISVQGKLMVMARQALAMDCSVKVSEPHKAEVTNYCFTILGIRV